jgi:signal transduction histidine kinase
VQFAAATHADVVDRRKKTKQRWAMNTNYLPAERASAATVQRQFALFTAAKTQRQLIDAVPHPVFVLNAERQIVFYNKAARALSSEDPSLRASLTAMLGQRVGEALHCIHAHDGPGGCGTSFYCTACRAASAIATVTRDEQQVREWVLTREVAGVPEVLTLRAQATAVTIEGEPLTVFTLTDIGHEKRRETLERIFFHDVINSAGFIRGIAEFMRQTPLPPALERWDIAGRLYRAADQLIDEIDHQRQLVAAEGGYLQVEPEILQAKAVLNEQQELYSGHPAAEGRQIVIDVGARNAKIVTDRSILARVIGNMIKNGLEASEAGQTITVGCGPAAAGVAFWVHNPSVIPDKVRLQIFQRSFSTKGTGRGLGTYGMKLLTERYLCGTVAFTSSPTEGTTFVVTLPAELGAARPA